MTAHIVIAGPGRSGTTLLVKILDRLGYDIGNPERGFYEQAQAGLESDILGPNPPRVIKNPDLTWQLNGYLHDGRVSREQIEWLIVPLRNLEQAAASRVRVTSASRDVHAPGGLVRTVRAGKQRQQLAETCYDLFLTAARHELPLIVLAYPLFATDSGYAYRTLSPMLTGISEAAFEEAWRAVVNPNLVRDTVAVPRFAGSRIVALRARRWIKARIAS